MGHMIQLFYLSLKALVDIGYDMEIAKQCSLFIIVLKMGMQNYP